LYISRNVSRYETSTISRGNGRFLWKRYGCHLAIRFGIYPFAGETSRSNKGVNDLKKGMQKSPTISRDHSTT